MKQIYSFETEINDEQWLILMTVNNYRLNYDQIKLGKLIKPILGVWQEIVLKIS